MQRRLPWSRAARVTVLVLGISAALAVVLAILLQSLVDAVRQFSDVLPGLVNQARDSDLGSFINSGSDSLDTLSSHASDIASGVGEVSGGLAHVGVSAFGAVTLAFSVIFLTLFGLIDEPRVRAWVAGLMY